MNKKVNYNSEDLKNHHAVGAIIKNEKGQILVQKHNKYNFLTLPIGKVLPNQTLEEGLKEEIFEECNLTIEEFKEVSSRVDIYDRNGIDVEVTLHLFEIIKYSGELQNKEPHKHSEQKFMSLEEVKNAPYLSDTTLLFLKLNGIKREAKI